MSFFYLHKLETLNLLTKNCTKSNISHEITNHAVAIGSRLQRLKSVAGKTASHENKKTFTETFDHIKFKQNPDKIVPNIS